MGKIRRLWAAGMLGLTAGCSIDNATLEKMGIPPPNNQRAEMLENPLLVNLPPEEKSKVFEAVYSVLDNFGFDIVESNRGDGRIETNTRIAPGLGLFFKSGSPEVRERALASLQTYRHRVTALVLDSKRGGFFVDIQVRKELESLPGPVRTSIGAAIFRVDNDVDRHYEVIDPSTPVSGWIYRGRDTAMELEIIRRIKAGLTVKNGAAKWLPAWGG